MEKIKKMENPIYHEIHISLNKEANLHAIHISLNKGKIKFTLA
jgi:hypothetical protein